MSEDNWIKILDQANKGEFQPKFQWHDEEYPKPTTPDGKIILGNMIQPQDMGKRRKWSPVAWLFGKRRIEMPEREVFVSTATISRVGDAWHDPLTKEDMVLVDYNDNFSSEYVDEPGKREWVGRTWIVQPYKIIDSRWESLKTRIAWYWKYVSRLYSFKSDQAVVDDMRRRGEL